MVTNQEPLVIIFQVRTDYPQALATKVPKNLRTFIQIVTNFLANKFDELLLTVTSSPALYILRQSVIWELLDLLLNMLVQCGHPILSDNLNLSLSPQEDTNYIFNA